MYDCIMCCMVDFSCCFWLYYVLYSWLVLLVGDCICALYGWSLLLFTIVCCAFYACFLLVCIIAAFVFRFDICCVLWLYYVCYRWFLTLLLTALCVIWSISLGAYDCIMCLMVGLLCVNDCRMCYMVNFLCLLWLYSVL